MLTPDQQADAARIKQRLLAAVDDDLQGIAELLASKPDEKLLGKAEFEVRDRVHRIGAKAVEIALNERKKGDTGAPARAVRAATAPANSRTVGTRPS